MCCAPKGMRSELQELVVLARSGRRSVLRRSFADVDISIAFIPRPLLSLFQVPISLAGMFVPVSGMLRFLALHEQRHQDQIREALTRPSAVRCGCRG